MKRSLLTLSMICLLFCFGANAQQDQMIKRGDYTLVFINNSKIISEELAQNIVNTFFEVYPKMVTEYNPEATKKVTILIDLNYKKVAVSGKGKITLGALWMQQHPEDTDLVTHELVHIVQDFKALGPEWLIEGLADCGRFQYGLNNAAADWSLPSLSSYQSYKMGYRVAARFLLWVNKFQESSTIFQLNTALKYNTYSADSWKEITGKSLDELWALYLQNNDID
ncbi:basic secretory protein-like protein [Pedobacter paludis]|uniref:Secretory protein n=1 Tax=Pedobacter paludis TaxID=2203212 RepID=A0A317EUX5_9SPHI|nr:basic secretory protein-like protein [Pedobacter paludis]PWS29639.1 secretory protein [Pedobacter paludis]